MNDAMRFLHVVSALGLTAAFGVEAAGLVGLRRATSAAQALLWLRTRRWVLLIGPGSIGLVLATGIYLTWQSGAPAPGSWSRWSAWWPWRASGAFSSGCRW